MWTTWWLVGMLGCRADSPGAKPEGEAAPPTEQVAPALPADAPATVLVVSLDTFRTDATGPSLAALRRRATRFSNVTTPAPTTLAAHTSVFTGLYPHHHGVPRNEHRVPEALDTLPERFQRAGYQTAAFLGAMPVGSHTGLLQGFDHVDERFDRARGGLYEQTERSGDKVTDAALAWLGEQPGPVFAFVHYYDAHAPYTPIPQLRPRKGPQQADMDTIYAARQGSSEVSHWLLASLYWADAHGADLQVGRLLEGLEAAGRGDALVVVLADHGESLKEHPEELYDHGNRVFDSTVSVPLYVAGPGVEPQVIDTPVSLVDVAPTLLGLVGLDGGRFDGVDLGPLIAGGSLDRGPVFTEATKPLDPPDSGWVNAKRWKKVRDGAWTLHWDPTTDAVHLFDTESDARESRDVAAEHPEVVARLRGLLDAWVATADPLPTERVSDAEALEKLRSLGYLE